MKTRIYFVRFVVVLLGFTSIQSRAQTIATVTEITINSKPSKSYLVNKEGKIVSAGLGVTIKGSEPFFMKANPDFHNAPSPFKNFIKTTNLIPVQKPGGLMEMVSKDVSYEYFDGLGSNTQKVEVDQSPQRNDLVTFVVKDKFERESRTYLPFASGRNGEFHDSPVDEQLAFYNGTLGVAKDNEPYIQNEYENSPRKKRVKTYSPGWSWHTESKPFLSNVKVNKDQEVLLLTLGDNGLPALLAKAYHPAGTLSIEETIDEAGLIKRIYRNLRNQVVTEMTGDSTQWNSTYHLFDVSGRLRFIFPPQATARINEIISNTRVQEFADTLCFQFKYDALGRQVEKKLPGTGWVYTLYDNWDRPVLVQDANLRQKNQWIFTKYDIHNRPVMTGIIEGLRANLESGIRQSTIRFEERAKNSIGYTNKSYPVHTEQNLLTINYYDCYSFLQYPDWDENVNAFYPVLETGQELDIFFGLDATKVYNPVVRGHKTGSKVKILDSSPTRWINSVQYYNKEYQVGQTITENYGGWSDVKTMTYDKASGMILTSKWNHKAPSMNIVINEEFSYDHADRLSQMFHKINGGPRVLMVNNKYNELGQRIEKNIHSLDNGKTFLQSMDYRYNIQGWLTHLNNSSLTKDSIINAGDDNGDLFGMEILYNSGVSVNNKKFESKPSYDGNISAIKWKTNTMVPGKVAQEKIYAFQHDVFKRFNQSYYATNVSGAWNGNPELYNEKILYFDKNGNIGGGTSAALSRFGMSNGAKVKIDHLVYRYAGNQLKNVLDSSAHNFGFRDKPGVGRSANEFNYDSNGNLIEDFNKSIVKIVYNYLNLPSEIRLAKTSPDRIDKILFTYDASGNKLRRQVIVRNEIAWSTEYLNGMQYENGKLSFVPTTEGRAVFYGSACDYEYFLKDHQGNVRVVYGSLKETNSYKATMEINLDDLERNTYGFRNITETRVQGNNVTPASDVASAPNRSSKCNSFGDATTKPTPVGVAKKLSVEANDAIYCEVYARYDNVRTTSKSITTTLLASYVNAAFNITSLENPSLWNGVNAKAPIVASQIPFASAVPKAYLAILFFNENNEFRGMDAQPISGQAYKEFEKLTISFTPTEKGYVYIYVANESTESILTDVYFDDLYIIHQKNNVAMQVLQACDYYPYGMPFNEYNADRLRTNSTSGEVVYEPTVRNRYLFQGQEMHRDLNLGWYEFKYRMHDPAIGRFGTIDPLSESYSYNSPYAFSANSLVNAVELEGLEPEWLFETMKRVSPFAFRINYSLTSHDEKIGYEVSFGFPKAFPFSYRVGYGASYNFDDIIQHKFVKETRSSVETSYACGMVSFQSTSYDSGPTSQTTGMLTVGIPLLNVQYENDWHPGGLMKFADPFGIHAKNGGDSGDRWRTAALRANAGLFSTGFKLATGDPGPMGNRNINLNLGGPGGLYLPAEVNGNYYDPNQYRLGLGYISFGDFQIGMNNELIRHQIQNVWTHDSLNPPSPWFSIRSYGNQLYFGVSNGTGTQW